MNVTIQPTSLEPLLIDISKDIEILTKSQQHISIKKFIDHHQPNGYLPFNDIVCQILNKLSQIILKDPVLRKDTGSVSLAYWLRNAQIQQIKQKFERLKDLEEQIIYVPVGKVFHVAPSNVDTMFVYSWAISFLCGNRNVVRVSGQKSEITIALIQCIDALMETESLLRENNLFITYPHNPEITILFSEWCSHRTIWGGNSTASAIRPLSLNAHASERIFASKFSYSVVNADFIISQDREALSEIANHFYNDIFWFDQMACSSPHIIFWVGDTQIVDESIRKLNSALAEVIQIRNYRSSTSSAVKRLNYAFDLATTKESTVNLENTGFISVKLDRSEDLCKEICGGGLITHVQVDSLSEIVEFTSDRDQTITHCGFEILELQNFAQLVGARGIDRIVPIGDALSFNIYWDGYNLVDDFTRKVVVY